MPLLHVVRRCDVAESESTGDAVCNAIIRRAVAGGVGGVTGNAGPGNAATGATPKLLVFAMDGKAALPEPGEPEKPVQLAASKFADAKAITADGAIGGKWERVRHAQRLGMRVLEGLFEDDARDSGACIAAECCGAERQCRGFGDEVRGGHVVVSVHIGPTQRRRL